MYNLANKSTHYAHRCRAVCMHLSDVKTEGPRRGQLRKL